MARKERKPPEETFGDILGCFLDDLPIPERQYKFALKAMGREWRFDFAWLEQGLAVEIEGGTFGRGASRHTTGKGHYDDCDKYNAAVLLEWRVLRFTTWHLERDPEAVADQVRKAFEA